MAADLSICVPSYNTRELLRDCLASLAGQAAGFAREVIVVDDASSDGTAEMVAAGFPDVRLLRNDRNRRFAASANRGLSAATGRYVLILNSDARLSGDVCGPLIRWLDAHPEVGLCGLRLLGADGTPQAHAPLAPTWRTVAMQALGLRRLLPLLTGAPGATRLLPREAAAYVNSVAPQSGPLPAEVVPGAFLLARRAAALEVGGFDEGHLLGAEDIDWCRRFAACGWRVVLFPAGGVVHLGGASTPARHRRVTAERYAGLLYYFQKHHGRGYARRVGWIILAGGALRLLAGGQRGSWSEWLRLWRLVRALGRGQQPRAWLEG